MHVILRIVVSGGTEAEPDGAALWLTVTAIFHNLQIQCKNVAYGNGATTTLLFSLKGLEILHQERRGQVNITSTAFNLGMCYIFSGLAVFSWLIC